MKPAVGQVQRKEIDRVALAAFVFSVISAVVSVIGFGIAEYENAEKRSVTEIDRLYDPQFTTSLSNILEKAYSFIDTEKEKNNPVKRFGDFWKRAGSVDADMLQISSRIKSISQCVAVGDCHREEVFSRFPETTYQALFFLRHFIFATPEVLSADQNGSVDGWWFGSDVYDLLSDYCAWAGPKMRGINLWSPKYERMMNPGQGLPNPCLQQRPDRKKT